MWHTRIEATMTLEELRTRYRNQILEIAEKRGARNVRVFGSIARGEQRSDSDIDILVDFQPGRSLLDLTGLWLDLEEVLGSKVDVVSSRGLKPRVAREIMRDAIAL
jgi:predicted nucleotidyltransferase